MASESKVMSQKEYLKRYLSSDKDKKKKKKPKLTSSMALKRSQVIDDDVDLKNMRVLGDDEIDLYQLDEDAPQIVGIVDERPPEVQAMEYYENTKRWKVFGNEDGNGEISVTDRHQSSVSKTGKEHKLQQSKHDEISQRNASRNESDSDLSPPRDHISKIKTNPSKAIHISKNQSNSDLSPPRKKHIGSDSDLSPPRKMKQQDRDSDLSPHRRRKVSPHRKSRRKGNSDSDLSPPRSSRSEKKFTNLSDSDLSPPRSSNKGRGSDSDLSPPRKSRTDKNSFSNSQSKPDKGSRIEKYSSKYDKHSNKRIEHGSSHEKERHSQKQKLQSEKKSKMDRTLEGKRAGLQDATQLKKELADFRDKEENVFSKLSADVSGKNAAPIMRDRKTGMQRNFEKEKQEALQKAQKESEKIEKYSRWGRGVKQVEDAAERVASAIREMAKPLARYADDDDLEKHLKAQEREGDPMLEYIRSKQSESTPLMESKPMYKGTFMPNRFGIRPGYRWDGVDRSNGFEKQWFTTQNSKKARDEEAYKWSTSDM